MFLSQETQITIANFSRYLGKQEGSYVQQVAFTIDTDESYFALPVLLACPRTKMRHGQ